jgi:N6-adenosine-specific RNA methylase IME4
LRATKVEAIKRLGLEEKQVQRFETLSRHPEIIEQVKAEARANDDLPTRTEALRMIAEEEKTARLRAAAETPALPDAKYRIIYGDPPWRYDRETHSGKGVPQKTVLASHYPPMEIEALRALPIRDLCEPDSVLFLWATSPKLPEALSVMEAWGFEYRTSMVWDKQGHMVGNYVSARHEFLLIGGRGSSVPDTKKLVDSVYSEMKTEHSRKPDYFRTLIDELYTHGKRIELFRRGAAPRGWDVWGNEARA